MKSQTLFAHCSLFFGNARLMVAFTFLSVVLSGAQTVELAWDPSPDAGGVASYRVHYGTSSENYSSTTNAGLATGLIVQGLSQGVTYYFAVTALGTNQLESDFSNEISYTVPLPNNTAPTITSIGNRTINEDNATGAIGFTVGDAETAAGSLVVTRSSSNTSLVPTANVVLGGSGATQTVTVTPGSNASGTAQITVQVSDGELSSSSQFTLTVNSVNDAPTLAALNDVTVAQDAGQQTVGLSGIGSGAANESQTLTLTAISSNPSLITPNVTYSSPSSTGTIRFTPAGGQNGSAQITVTVSDNGGTANGGVNSFQRLFTVNVIQSDNAPPTLNDISDVTVVQAEGEPGLNLGAMGAGTTIWAVAPVGESQTQTVNLTGIGTGGESSQTLAVAATSSNPTVVPPPTVSYSSPAATGSLTLSPPAGSTGSAVITVTVTDDGGGADTVQKSFTVNVNGPANSAPSITTIASQNMNEDGVLGPVGFTVSDAQSSAGSLVVTAASGNPTLVVDSSLQLGGNNASRNITISPSANQSGKALVTLTVADGGGAVANKAFWINVNPVNDAPTLNAVADVALNGNEIETVSLDGIGVGPLDGLQGMTVQASSSNPSIVPNPEVVYYSPGATAELQLAPPASASGSATVTVTVKDDGGTANGGQDTRTRSFTVTTAPAVASASAASAEAGTVQSAGAASLAAPQAVLQISTEGGQVVLSWNGAAGPYVLQRSTGFDAGADWVDVDAVPESVDGSALRVTVQPEHPAEFFRLSSGL